jgi:hypothetical protein
MHSSVISNPKWLKRLHFPLCSLSFIVQWWILMELGVVKWYCFVYAFLSSMHSCFFLFLQILWAHMSCSFLLLLQVHWVILWTFHELLVTSLVKGTIFFLPLSLCSCEILVVNWTLVLVKSCFWVIVWMGFVIFICEFLISCKSCEIYDFLPSTLNSCSCYILTTNCLWVLVIFCLWIFM